MEQNLGYHEVKLDSNSMIVTETNERGNITFVSKDFCTIAGYSKDELIGKSHNYIRNSFMPKAAFKDLWDTIKSGKRWNGTVVNSSKDGGYYWVKATVYPSQNRDGTLKYISVRVMPTQEEIDKAIKLYPTI